MKFRAKMDESLSIRNLALIAAALNKLGRQCTLRLSSSHFTVMICDENSSPKQVVLWCVVEATKFFNEYNLEGITEANEIYLLVPSDMLSTSLATLRTTNNSAQSVKLKLTDKNTPCLTVEIALSAEYGMTRCCIHDIPVKLISRQSWSDYSPPPQDDGSVILEMKSLKKLRAVLEKCKKLSPWVSLSVSPEGNLSISILSTTATVTTLFKNTVAIPSDNEMNDCTVKVDVKRLNTLMSTETLAPKRTLLHFFENRKISFHLACDSFTFYFFLMGVED